ncbi:uncharacterized protein LOC125004900 isoform X2 [Mugil cephalus]|nr:uncharacterized protein LOC125004900 isoform X2 [Mugil cephalus]
METFLSTPSSTEDEGSEENHQTITVEEITEAGIQEATVEEAEEKSVPVTNGDASALTNGQATNDSGSKGGTYTYDSVQKIFTPHQPKTPYVKKIKILNGAKVAKTDPLGERVSGERKSKDDTSPPAGPACTVALQNNTGNSEEAMEVEHIVNASAVDSDSINTAEEHQKSTPEDKMLVERPSKDKNTSTEATVPSERERLTAAPPSASHTVSGTEGKIPAKHEREGGCKDRKENLMKQRQNLHTTPSQSSVSSTLLKDIRTTEHTAMDVDVKSRGTSDGSLPHRHSESPDSSFDSEIALPQRLCEPAGDQLPEKETRHCQRDASVPQPALPSEVTQAHTKMNRNDAPAGFKLPPDEYTIGSQPPQKTPIERETKTDDIQTSALHSVLQTAIDTMAQDTQDHSKESNESHTILLAHIQKSSLESPGGGEKTQGCRVSAAVLQSQVDTAIKTVEGTEIQDGKVKTNEMGKLLLQPESVAPQEIIVDMETETIALHTTEQSKNDKTNDAENKDASVIVADTSYKETEKNEPMSKAVEKTSSESQNLKPDKLETGLPDLTKTPDKIDSVEHLIDFKEIPKPVTKVISVAELLRSQMKALDSTLANQEVRDDGRKSEKEVKKSMPDRGTGMSTDNTPPTNIKATLIEVYHQLNKTDQEQIQTQGATSPPVQALGIPPVSAIDNGSTVDITGLDGCTKKYNEGVMDIGLETQESTLVPSRDSHPEGKKVKPSFPPLASEYKVINSVPSISNSPGTVSPESDFRLTVTHMKTSIQEPCVAVLEQTKEEPVQGKDMEFTQRLTPEIKLNSNSERGIAEMNLTPLSDPCNMEEGNMNTSSSKSTKMFPTESELRAGRHENNLQLIQQESSMVEECLRPDSLASPTPGPSSLLKKRNGVSLIPSATPQELALGARRKILTAKAKPEEATEPTTSAETQKKGGPIPDNKFSTSSVSPSLSRQSPLLQPAGEPNSLVERRSPLLTRRKAATETPTPSQLPAGESNTEGKPAEKDKSNPFKAPQVIRKIRAESFADASGHLKLWCQFFNVLADSVIKWYKNEREIAQVERKAGDESHVNLAIVQASGIDSGVYGCSITNEYGTDLTDILLSGEILAGMSLREDLGVGEEIEMTPMIFNKGVADSGALGNKFFGRIMMNESQIGGGCSHKVWRAKVIYGLEPVFESGNTCIIKACNPIAYEGKEETRLIDRNLDIMKQGCKIQNLAREYCKIFSAEARVIENFGPSLEVIPVYLMYRPANTVPYATVETDLIGVYQKYSALDHTGRLETRTGSEVEQKCCALQHWIFQWTNGNLLFTRLEGVDTKITNVGISVKSTGHQGLSVEGNPKVFEQFVSQHKCNYFCGLLSLRSLKVMDSLMTPTKPKGSRSPLLQRKMAAGSSSPQTGRKAAGSPRVPRKAEQDGRKTPTKQKGDDVSKGVKTA